MVPESLKFQVISSARSCQGADEVVRCSVAACIGLSAESDSVAACFLLFLLLRCPYARNVRTSPQPVRHGEVGHDLNVSPTIACLSFNRFQNGSALGRGSLLGLLTPE